MGILAYKLKQAAMLAGVSFRGYDINSGNEIFCYIADVNCDPLMFDDKFRNDLIELAKHRKIPVIFYESNKIVYSVFSYDNLLYVLGPATVQAVQIVEEQVYAISHKVHDVEGFALPRLDIGAFESLTGLVYALVSGEEPIEISCVNESVPPEPIEKYGITMLEIMQDFTERDDERLTYREETVFFDTMGSGNIEALQKSKLSRLYRHMGFFSNDLFKQREYTACMIITLAARAAIRGGLSPETALSMQDMAMQRLAQNCKTVSEIEVLCTQALSGFGNMVNRSKKETVKNRHVDKAKGYINNHLSTSFTLEEVARHVGVSPNYLCRRFKELDGVGMKQYTQNKRLAAAADMLRFTDMPITNIASYFCYSSQSYFSKCFKEQYNVTPQKYRNNQTI